MFDPATVAFLESGCAQIIATVGADGEPLAAHAWGITIDDPSGTEVRLILDADDTDTLANLDAGRAIAITGADVPTLRSMQMKGRSAVIEPATAADRRRARRFCDDFITAVNETDGSPRDLLERLVPANFVACLVRVDTFYNQTPGPSAGTSMPEESE